MSRNGPDYSKTVIYKIVYDTTCYYVGATTNFIHRSFNHKTCCNNKIDPKHNLKIYTFMRNNGWTGEFVLGGWFMVPIETFPCKSKLESSAREFHHYTLLNPSLNTQVPGRTKKEYHAISNPITNVIKKNCPHCNKEVLRTHLNRHLKICKLRPIEPVVDSSTTLPANASSPLLTPDAVLA